jgi:protein TonB
MVRAMLASGAAHLLVAAALVFGPLLIDSPPKATPLTIDVSIVDISELETVMPPAVVGRTDEPKAQPRIPDPVDQVERKAVPPKPKELSKDSIATVSKKEPPAAESSPAVAPPVGESTLGGGSETVEKARVNYRDMVALKLARAKRYPERAVRNLITGRGSIRLKIDARGEVVSADIAESTQSDLLDDELLRMVNRAAPFPVFPEGMKQSELSLLVPVSFRLED